MKKGSTSTVCLLIIGEQGLYNPDFTVCTEFGQATAFENCADRRIATEDCLLLDSTIHL